MENLKKFRENKKLSAIKLARILNVSKATYYNYESGITNPDIKTLIELSKVLKVSIDELVGNPYSKFIDLTNKELDILSKSVDIIEIIIAKLK